MPTTRRCITQVPEFQVPRSRFWFGFQVRVPSSGSRSHALKLCIGNPNLEPEPEPGTLERGTWNLALEAMTLREEIAYRHEVQQHNRKAHSRQIGRPAAAP